MRLCWAQAVVGSVCAHLLKAGGLFVIKKHETPGSAAMLCGIRHQIFLLLLPLRCCVLSLAFCLVLRLVV